MSSLQAALPLQGRATSALPTHVLSSAQLRTAGCRLDLDSVINRSAVRGRALAVIAALAIAALAARPGAGRRLRARARSSSATRRAERAAVAADAPSGWACARSPPAPRRGAHGAQGPPWPDGVARRSRALRRQPGVAWAVPNYVAHAAGDLIPDDPGRGNAAGGWQRAAVELPRPPVGVNAPEAWANLRGRQRPGGRGVVVAVLDTGVAYRNWQPLPRSPDFAATQFVEPYDFVGHNRFPHDRNGHGTFVAGTIAEATNNRLGLTGLAYGATIMPVRVLDSRGRRRSLDDRQGHPLRGRARRAGDQPEPRVRPSITPGDIPEHAQRDPLRPPPRRRSSSPPSGNEGTRRSPTRPARRA